jgi:rhodanese-related sulfurtransferase
MTRKTAQDLVDEAMKVVTTYSVDHARSLLGRQEVLFVDVRDIRELEREGVIPGAFHAPRGMIEFWVDPQSPYFHPELGEGKELVLFCGAGWRSALAARTLMEMGVDRVAHVDGGFEAWKAAGAPTAEKPRRARPEA